MSTDNKIPPPPEPPQYINNVEVEMYPFVSRLAQGLISALPAICGLIALIFYYISNIHN